jgi:hypothetical protein
MNTEHVIHSRVVPPHIEQIRSSFMDLSNIYSELVTVNQYDMPQDIISETYSRFMDELTELTRHTREQYNNHISNARRAAREERRHAAAPPPAVQVVIPQPVAAAPLTDNTVHPTPTVIPPLPPTVIHPLPPTVVPPTPPTVVPLNEVMIDLTAAAPVVQRKRVRKQPTIPKRCSRIVSRAAFLQPATEDPCSICYEPYIRGNTVAMDCSHMLCKTCYNTYETTCLGQTNPLVTCPLCRVVVTRPTEFRLRKSTVIPNPSA